MMLGLHLRGARFCIQMPSVRRCSRENHLNDIEIDDDDREKTPPLEAFVGVRTCVWVRGRSMCVEL